MKAVVLDISGGEATVMTKSGDIIGIRDESYDIGQEITVRGSVALNIVRFMPAIAAAAILFIVAGTGSYAYLSPYGTVSLDVNPSIEYSINRFDKVLSVSGVNDDGSDIVSSLDISELKYKDIETAIDNTIDQIDAEGYFDDEADNYVVVTANTGADAHTDKLVERLDKTVSRHERIMPITSKVSDEELRNAHEQGISAGKKMMVDRLDDISDDKIDRDKWNGRSVRDIVNEYDRIKREKEEPGKDVINTGSEPDNEASDVPGVTDSGSDTVNEIPDGSDIYNPAAKEENAGMTGGEPSGTDKPSGDAKPSGSIKPSAEDRGNVSDTPALNNVIPSDRTKEQYNGQPPADTPVDNGNAAPPQGDDGGRGSEGTVAAPRGSGEPGSINPAEGNDVPHSDTPAGEQNGGDRGGMDNPPADPGNGGAGPGPQGGPGGPDGGGRR